mmetsp:Transcript_7574/g.17362  ORF Transcript_7574/g.17362 Transcript_7574/m.17362 type:complete len:225 (+) Transcript_7574:138-812(+)|eukprot:CAMPEP_0114558842 /NCGR_PEP_ID=MMETSP0114-20121206/10602_1 /TAXON_ID=31324 /ORGANISM="Goniomonas sp, Strain m" /LENGTH=224 /DNA_ID=CAMNT_0001744269 /DNA_START=138 /DNA_END=812 /DNA_ORIENTATION=-
MSSCLVGCRDVLPLRLFSRVHNRFGRRALSLVNDGARGLRLLRRLHFWHRSLATDRHHPRDHAWLCSFRNTNLQDAVLVLRGNAIHIQFSREHESARELLVGHLGVALSSLLLLGSAGHNQVLALYLDVQVLLWQPRRHHAHKGSVFHSLELERWRALRVLLRANEGLHLLPLFLLAPGPLLPVGLIVEDGTQQETLRVEEVVKKHHRHWIQLFVGAPHQLLRP